MTAASLRPQVHGIFDPGTWTVSYIVHHGPGTACAIIDSVLDYDAKAGRTRTTSADKVVAYVQENQLRVEWILETHAHADHITAAPYLKQKLGGKVAIGHQITAIQKVFKAHYVLMNIEVGQETLDELEHAFKFNDAVLRHLTVKMDAAVTAPSPMMKEEKSRSVDVNDVKEAPKGGYNKPAAAETAVAAE